MKLAVLLAGVMAALLLPAAAEAYSGSITNVVPNGDGYSASATYTATETPESCTTYGFCGWFPEAGQVAAGQACPDSTPSSLTYVGDLQDQPGTMTRTATFYPESAAVRLCLYVSGPDLADHLVAAYDYGGASSGPAPTPPPPTPTPTPPSGGGGTTVPPLTIADARATLPRILRRKFHSRFTHRRHYTRSCYRYSAKKVRCWVRWQSGAYRYSGPVTMWNDPADPANSIIYMTSIQRRRVHAPKRRPAPSSPAHPACDPNYAGACLNPNASDYDCRGGSGNGPYYTGPVRVVGVDHFHLDANHDGIGCNDS